MSAATLAIAAQDVEAAAGRIAGAAVRTPLLRSTHLDERVGARLFIKPENLQRTGSFKFRGAFNRLSAMDASVRARGIVAASSGNHAQGVAEAARLFGVPATIVMPADAPQTKIRRTQRSGARVVAYDRATEDRLAIARDLSAQSDATFVPPYDDPFVMAGQGTTGLEIAADLKSLGFTADRVLVPTGGGGLLSGIATALGGPGGPTCQPAEPEGFDDTTRSLQAGARVANRALTGSCADALMANTPGALTFAVNQVRAAPGYAVSEQALLAAVRIAFDELKLVVEPGGAAALAAALFAGAARPGETVVVVLSGGNIDVSVLARAMATADP
ncbi:MAG: threonine/serine dehydratase [Pseudomonadota bacterium]